MSTPPRELRQPPVLELPDFSTSQPLDFLSLSFVFIYILALFPRKSVLSGQLSALSYPIQAGADPEVWGLRCPEGTGPDKWFNLPGPHVWRIADVQEQLLRQPTVFELLDSSTSQPLNFLSLSFVFIYILALFPRKLVLSSQLSALSYPIQAGADPGVRGLRCPEGTGQGKGGNLPELRLRRMTDVQKQRLRPPAPVVIRRLRPTPQI